MPSPANAEKSAPERKEPRPIASDVACACGVIMWRERPSGTIICGACSRPHPEVTGENARPTRP